MRLRLFERLGRLVGWRFGSQGEGSDRPRDPAVAGTEVAGKHRRNAGGSQALGRVAAWTTARLGAVPPTRSAPRGTTSRTTLLDADSRAREPDMQPPAGLPRRAPRSPSGGTTPRSPAPRAAGSRAGRPAMPPLPRNYAPGQGGGIGRARIREAPFGAAPLDTVARPQSDPDQASGAAAARQPAAQPPRQPWYQVVGGPPAARRLTGRAAPAAARDAASAGQAVARPAHQAAAQPPVTGRPGTPASGSRALLPFSAPHPRGHPVTADGLRNCGPLESVLWRQWDAASTTPPPQVIATIDRLAEFPRELQEKLADGLDGIYVGDGGVPDLDDMAALHGVPLPSGKATWDACAGAYGDRKIVVGTRPSPTPDVLCHEVGHALDDLDSPPGKWQSDSAEFRLIYDQCQPFIASDFHRQRGGLGRKEFFADSFAAIASAQRPALVDMLGGNTRIALRVMLYFNRRYGI
jgi:hypothetical protein